MDGEDVLVGTRVVQDDGVEALRSTGTTARSAGPASWTTSWRRWGGSCTLFQRLDDEGSTVRAAATVADRPYFTAYAGIGSPDGRLIGMLYVSLPIDPSS